MPKTTWRRSAVTALILLGASLLMLTMWDALGGSGTAHDEACVNDSQTASLIVFYASGASVKRVVQAIHAAGATIEEPYPDGYSLLIPQYKVSTAAAALRRNAAFRDVNQVPNQHCVDPD